VLVKQIFTVKNIPLWVLFFVTVSCGRTSTDQWVDLVPESVLAVIVPENNQSLNEFLTAQYLPLLDDITPSAFQIVTNVQENSESQIIVNALLLYPDTSNDWQPLWITNQISGLKSRLTALYQRDFEQNQYEFLGTTIEKFFMADRVLFWVEIGNYTLFSESSLAIESALRTLHGEENNLNITQQDLSNGAFILNIPALDTWTKQLAQVTFRPFLNDIFQGSSPAVFQLNQNENSDWNWQFAGSMQLQREKSTLLESVSSTPQDFILDRFIPISAAAFSIFRLDPGAFFEVDFELNHETDQFLESNSGTIEALQQDLGDEVAFVAFAESGPTSSSEYLFLRSVNNPTSIRNFLDNLTERNLIIRDNNTYSIDSQILGKVFGSELNTMENFYLTLYDQVISIAQRKGLAESVGGDSERRRVMFYNDDYTKVRNSLGGSLSSIFYMNSPRFSLYIQPWLFPQNYLNRVISNLDDFVIATRLQPGGNELEITFSNFEREMSERPNQEQWTFPIGDTDLTGKPVFANLSGSVREEIVFSTVNSSVFILASDGTAVVKTSTNDDIPIGSPVVYDWYGNNQNVIMQAAGDKVYAWNRSGDLLPNFPVSVGEEITTPLTVMDFTGNGVAELILATADRNIHILNARGQAINGWPQSTNSVVRFAPLITELNGTKSLFVFAENTLHGWYVNGLRRTGYPQFLPSQMQGRPEKFENHILGAGLDGNLYSVGLQPLFSDSLSTTLQSESLEVQSLTVSNSSLNVTPSQAQVLYRNLNGTELVRNNLIVLQSSNGSIFLYQPNGELVFTKSLGQPSSETHRPIILDINGDDRQDLVALADFGRIYAWDILSGQRHLDLPTTGMSHPVISDYFGDGNMEIIALTRNGIQSWTIYSTRLENASEGE
tara:strand:- start:11567 stop:14245 length:2679 start_codon:yes stop_codon:yes gene_type:complete